VFFRPQAQNNSRRSPTHTPQGKRSRFFGERAMIQFFWRKKQKARIESVIIILQMSRAIIPDARWTRVISVARRGIISPGAKAKALSAPTSLHKIFYCVLECECRAVQ
jgi:hypothetical protein